MATIHKVVVLGEGRTQLIRCLCPDASPNEHGIAFSEVLLPEHQCLLQLWDVPERQETSTVYRNARVVIVASRSALLSQAVSERIAAIRSAAPMAIVGGLEISSSESSSVPEEVVDSLQRTEDATAPLAWHARVQLGNPHNLRWFVDSVMALLAPATLKDDEDEVFSPTATMTKREPDRLLILLMIGSLAVGKTTLLTMYSKRVFLPLYSATYGVDFASCRSTFDDNVRVQVWDTAGASPSPGFTKGARGYVMVYDVTSRESFDALPALARDWCLHMDGTVPIVVVGNKCDLESLREVETAEGSAYARRIGAFFVEASASENKSVIRAFELVGAEAARREAERFRTF